MTYPQSPEYLTALKSIRAELNKYDELRGIKMTLAEDLLGGDAYGMWEYGGGTTHKNLQDIKNIQHDAEAAAAVDFLAFMVTPITVLVHLVVFRLSGIGGQMVGRAALRRGFRRICKVLSIMERNHG